jgi:hypothetical protein
MCNYMHNVTLVFVSAFLRCATALTGPQPPHYLGFILTHTHSLVLLWTSDQPDAEAST